MKKFIREFKAEWKKRNPTVKRYKVEVDWVFGSIVFVCNELTYEIKEVDGKYYLWWKSYDGWKWCVSGTYDSIGDALDFLLEHHSK